VGVGDADHAVTDRLHRVGGLCILGIKLLYQMNVDLIYSEQVQQGKFVGYGNFKTWGTQLSREVGRQ